MSLITRDLFNPISEFVYKKVFNTETSALTAEQRETCLNIFRKHNQSFNQENILPIDLLNLTQHFVGEDIKKFFPSKREQNTVVFDAVTRNGLTLTPSGKISVAVTCGVSEAEMRQNIEHAKLDGKEIIYVPQEPNSNGLDHASRCLDGSPELYETTREFSWNMLSVLTKVYTNWLKLCQDKTQCDLDLSKTTLPLFGPDVEVYIPTEVHELINKKLHEFVNESIEKTGVSHQTLRIEACIRYKQSPKSEGLNVLLFEAKRLLKKMQAMGIATPQDEHLIAFANAVLETSFIERLTAIIANDSLALADKHA